LRLTRDIESRLSEIKAPTQITFGRHDHVTSTRFASILTENIRDSELLIFEDCSDAPIYENVADSTNAHWSSCSAIPIRITQREKVLDLR
jgi:pimeloyl-ACP methyl ester carboxylesterase